MHGYFFSNWPRYNITSLLLGYTWVFTVYRVLPTQIDRFQAGNEDLTWAVVTFAQPQGFDDYFLSLRRFVSTIVNWFASHPQRFHWTWLGNFQIKNFINFIECRAFWARRRRWRRFLPSIFTSFPGRKRTFDGLLSHRIFRCAIQLQWSRWFDCWRAERWRIEPDNNFALPWFPRISCIDLSSVMKVGGAWGWAMGSHKTLAIINVAENAVVE